jgi:hypothetical protein
MQRLSVESQHALYDDLLTPRKTAADNGSKLEAKLIGDVCEAIELYLPPSQH